MSRTCVIPNCPVCAYQLPQEDCYFPSKRRRRFFLFFGMQFIAYSLATWDFRAMAKGFFWNAIAANLLIAALGFTLISKVAEAKDHPARFGYIIGGTVGAGCTLLLTKFIWGS